MFTICLTPIAQFTNGELVNMSEEEWERLVNYVKVLLALFTEEEAAPQSMLDRAIQTASVTLTAEQLMAMLESIRPFVPESMLGVYDLLLSVATYDNVLVIMESIAYMQTSVAGFDLYEIEEQPDGSVTVETVTNNGFGDRFNHGLRIFAKTTDYLLIGTANPFCGTQLWRRDQRRHGGYFRSRQRLPPGPCCDLPVSGTGRITKPGLLQCAAAPFQKRNGRNHPDDPDLYSRSNRAPVHPCDAGAVSGILSESGQIPGAAGEKAPACAELQSGLRRI